MHAFQIQEAKDMFHCKLQSIFPQDVKTINNLSLSLSLSLSLCVCVCVCV